jgi:hypothetical protein
MPFWEIMFWLWVIGFVVSWPIISRWLYRHEFCMDDDVMGVAMMIILGLTIAPFWPLIIPGYFIYEFVISDGGKK